MSGNPAGLGALSTGNSLTLTNQVQTSPGYRGARKACLTETGDENPGTSHVTPTTRLQETQICSENVFSLGEKGPVSERVPELTGVTARGGFELAMLSRAGEGCRQMLSSLH